MNQITLIDSSKKYFVHYINEVYGPLSIEDATVFMSNCHEEPRLFEVVEKPVVRNLVYKCVIKSDAPPPPPPPPPPAQTFESVVKSKKTKKTTKGRGTFG